MVGSWDSSRHGSDAYLECAEHEYAGPDLSLTIQKHLLWMPKFVTYFYSTLHMATFLLVPLEKADSREATRQADGKKVNWDSTPKSCGIEMGIVSPFPFSGFSCSLLSS